MKAVWYEQNGPAEMIQYGEMPDPEPGAGEVRVRVVSSGVNPSDWKRRAGLTTRIAFPRVIPHQDGAGVIDRVGPGVPESRVGERVWLFESQFGRPFGSAAEYTVQPSGHVVRMPDSVSFEQGGVLGRASDDGSPLPVRRRAAERQGSVGARRSRGPLGITRCRRPNWPEQR